MRSIKFPKNHNFYSSGKGQGLKSPTDIIADSGGIALNTNLAIAKRIGLTRQTLTRKRKYPSTFTAGEVYSLAKLFNWTDQQIAEFIRGCRG